MILTICVSFVSASPNVPPDVRPLPIIRRRDAFGCTLVGRPQARRPCPL